MSSADEKIAEGKKIVLRLRREMKLAQLAWAHWEAINGKLSVDRRELRAAVDRLGLGREFDGLRGIFARETVLVLYRMTDPPGEDRQTLCRLSKIISDSGVCDRLASKCWLIQDGWLDYVAEGELKHRHARLERIRQRIPPKWSDVPPKRPAVYNLRSKLQPLRHHVLAHVIDDSRIAYAQVRELRAFMRLVSGLVMEADLLFCGMSNETLWDETLAATNRLWDHFSIGPIEESKSQLAKD
jgi:hypothetical protein